MEKEIKMYTVMVEDKAYNVVDTQMFNAAVAQGYPAEMAANIVNQGLAYLKIFGKVICAVLDYAPTHELSMDWPVDGSCILTMTVSKK